MAGAFGTRSVKSMHQNGQRRNGSRPVKRVLIAGGGVAALEAMLALRSLAYDRVRVELCRRNETSSTVRWRSPSRSGSAA